MGRTIDQMVVEVRAAFEKQLSVRGRNLEAQIRKAQRRLPRRVRADATYLAQARHLADNPKLARMIDHSAARDAHRRVLAFLETIDLAAERRTAVLNVVASIAFAVLTTAILFVAVLWVRGFV